MPLINKKKLESDKRISMKAQMRSIAKLMQKKYNNSAQDFITDNPNIDLFYKNNNLDNVKNHFTKLDNQDYINNLKEIAAIFNKMNTQSQNIINNEPVKQKVYSLGGLNKYE